MLFRRRRSRGAPFHDECRRPHFAGFPRTRRIMAASYRASSHTAFGQVSGTADKHFTASSPPYAAQGVISSREYFRGADADTYRSAANDIRRRRPAHSRSPTINGHTADTIRRCRSRSRPIYAARFLIFLPRAMRYYRHFHGTRSHDITQATRRHGSGTSMSAASARQAAADRVFSAHDVYTPKLSRPASLAII